jgi:hypothetical protein
VLTGAKIAAWPLAKPKRQDGAQNERAATLFRRMRANRPIYKPEYWEMVKELDGNSNEEDPSNNCMPAGVSRMGSLSYIGQFPNYLIFIYPEFIGARSLVSTSLLAGAIRYQCSKGLLRTEGKSSKNSSRVFHALMLAQRTIGATRSLEPRL